MIAGLTDLKNFTGLTSVSSEDAPLTTCLMAADAIMKTYCNRPAFELRQYVQPLDPTDACNIMVPNIPLVTVNGITAYQYFADTYGYPALMPWVKWNRSGMITSVLGIFQDFANSCLVDYTAGYAETDPEWSTIVWLQLEIAAELYRGRGVLNLSQFVSGAAQIQRISTGVAYGDSERIAEFSPEVILMLNMFAIRGPRIDY
jgi:hypothetical protein